MARILVVEKKRSRADLLRTYLVGADHVITIVPDGRAAWRRLAADPGIADVAVLDCRLADGDGAAFVHRLRAHPRLRRLPVVFCVPEPAVRHISAASLAATWVVELPLRGRALHTAIDEALRSATTVRPSNAVLIAHPLSGTRDEWADRLETDGFDVYTVETAAALLERLEQSIDAGADAKPRVRPELAFAWAHGEDHDGHAILRFCRAFAVRVPVALIVDPARVDAQWRATARALGATAIVEFADLEAGALAISAVLKRDRPAHVGARV